MPFVSIHVTQSHKNPCSVAALLRGKFGSLVDFAEIFTKSYAVLSQNSLQVLPCFQGKIKKKIFCFIEIFPQILFQPFWKFPQKVAFIAHFNQKMSLWEISTNKLPLWKISTKLCLVGKFPQHQALLENFRTKVTLLEHFKKIQKKPSWKKFSTKICCVANFHQNLLFLKTYKIICFI